MGEEKEDNWEKRGIIKHTTNHSKQYILIPSKKSQQLRNDRTVPKEIQVS